MYKADQEIRFYSIQKNRQYVNDQQKKELDEIHNKSPYSSVAFPEMQNLNDPEAFTPQDISMSIMNNNIPISKKLSEIHYQDEVQNSFNSKINEGEFYSNLKHTSPTCQYRRSIDNSSQEFNGAHTSSKYKSDNQKFLQSESKIVLPLQLYKKIEVVISLKDSLYSQQGTNILQEPYVLRQQESKLLQSQLQKQSSLSEKNSIWFKKPGQDQLLEQIVKIQKKQVSFQAEKIKKEEKRAIQNWRKMKQLFKKNKPLQQLTLDQYRLINDWASNEYKIVQEEKEKQEQGQNSCCNNIFKDRKRKKKIKKNSIIASLIQVQKMINQIERKIFPHFTSFIPVFKTDSLVVFCFEVYLYGLYTYFLIKNWMIVVFSIKCYEYCDIQSNQLLVIVVFSSILECLKNLNKSLTINGDIISQRNQLICLYIRNNFSYDLIFIFLVLFLFISSPESSYLHFILRLGIIVKIKPYFNLMNNLINSFEVMPGLHNGLRIFDLVFSFIFFTHTFSSLYFIQARVVNRINQEINTWIDEIHIPEEDWLSLYIESTRRVSYLMIGKNSGSDKSNNFEKCFEVFTFFIGITLFSFFIQKSLSYLKDYQKKEQQQRNEINGLITYLGKQKVNDSLKLKIISYLKKYHKEERSILRSEGTQDAMQKLSDDLKRELTIHTNTEYLKMFQFFKNFSEELKLQIMNIMVEKIYQPGQKIFEDGETSDSSIYLIQKGKINLYYDTRRSGSKYSVVKEMSQNEVFGQIAFLTGFPRKCYATSKEITSLISVDRDQFLKILKTSREEKDLQIFCQMRDSFLNDGDQSVLDLSCFQCGSKTHLSDQCNKTHYYIHRKAILKTLSSDYKIVNRHKFKRFRLEKKHTLQSHNRIQQSIAGFVEKFEEQINFLQEDIHMKRFYNSQSQSLSHNQIKYTGSSEQALPIQNSDDQVDYQQSSQSSDSDEKSSISEKSNSNTEKASSFVMSEKDVEITNNNKKRGSNKNIGGGSNKNLNCSSSKNLGSGTDKVQKIKKQKTDSNQQAQKSTSQNTIGGNQIQAENIKNSISNLVSQSQPQQVAQINRINSKNMINQSNLMHSNPASTLSPNTTIQHVNSDIQNEEIEEFLNINNEQTIGSIFQNFDKKKQLQNKDSSDQQIYKQKSSYKMNNTKQSSFTTFNNNTNQRSSSFSNNVIFTPKISVSCSELESSNQSVTNVNQIQPPHVSMKKGNVRHSYTFNNVNYGDSRSITNKDNFETSSSTESNTTELFFDPQLAPLTALYSQPQLMHTQTAFEQGNIIIIEQKQNQQEEKCPRKSKFDILQEKMKDIDSESTPVSLIESIYNMDSHPNNNIPAKRKGILPYSTSLSENMRKIGRLYSKGSTKTSNGIGQVLNLQMINQFTHKSNYTNPNDLQSVMYLDKMKSFHYYFPQFNIESILLKIEKYKKSVEQNKGNQQHQQR